jgi:hypothetical protein
VAIDTAIGRVTIAGFCSVKENFFPPETVKSTLPVIPPGIMVNSMEAYNSALRIKELSALVVPLHERETLSVQKIP